MKKDLISIVVPVYNAEKYLDDTINTVLNQSYTNWELLLINDCSKDNSKNVAKNYLKDKRIKWIDLEKNSGAAIARNKGIDLSKGNYLCFLDVDDLWDKDKLKIQLDFMKKNNCEFSFTGYEFADSNGKPNGKKVFVPKTITYNQALKNTTICTITVMFNMRLLLKSQINMPNVRSEDTATWWKVLKSINKAFGINLILSYYRRGINSKSSNKCRAISQIWELYRKIEKFNIIKSFYYFCGYAFNAVKRRI